MTSSELFWRFLYTYEFYNETNTWLIGLYYCIESRDVKYLRINKINTYVKK